MNIFPQNYRKNFKNPYRHGVLIGNYTEDIFGQDLKKKYENENVDTKKYISETMDRFTRPELKEENIKVPGNDITMKCNSNFDLNIDFTKKNAEDYLKLQEKTQYELNNKNLFLPNEIKSEYQMKTFEEKKTGMQIPLSIESETQKSLKDFHKKDATGLLYTKQSGLVRNLYFGHGLDQRNFQKNEYASTYHLTINKKERTDAIYNPKYKVTEPFKFTEKKLFDTSDWDFRRFKKYDEFTKTFDKNTNTEK